MNITRATEKEIRFVKNIKSLMKKLAYIAKLENRIIGVFEIDIHEFRKAKIINFEVLDEKPKYELLKAFLEEVRYWNPFITTISFDYQKEESDFLVKNGFIKKKLWEKEFEEILIFQIGIKEIEVCQLSVDVEKYKNANNWIVDSNDVIISVIKKNNKVYCVDGYSRLVAALDKKIDYVWAYEENDEANSKFIEESFKWCQNEGILKLEDLKERIVPYEQHKKIWLDRCKQYFLKNN